MWGAKPPARRGGRGESPRIVGGRERDEVHKPEGRSETKRAKRDSASPRESPPTPLQELLRTGGAWVGRICSLHCVCSQMLFSHPPTRFRGGFPPDPPLFRGGSPTPHTPLLKPRDGGAGETRTLTSKRTTDFASHFDFRRQTQENPKRSPKPVRALDYAFSL